MKYIEKKHDISNALFESSKLSRANYSKTQVQNSCDMTMTTNKDLRHELQRRLHQRNLNAVQLKPLMSSKKE